MNYTVEEIKDKIKEFATGDYIDGSSASTGYTYHPIPFSGFKDVPVHKTACEDEWGVISPRIEFKNQKVLEIGCANGYYSFNMASEGANVEAYEHDPQVFEVNKMLQTLDQAKDLDVRFVNKAFRKSDLVGKKFGICLMLNVHMWIEKQIGAEETRRMMREIARSCMTTYFQTAHAESGGMHTLQHLSNGKAIKEYLLDAGFSKVTEINRSTKHGGVRILYEALGN